MGVILGDICSVRRDVFYHMAIATRLNRECENWHKEVDAKAHMAYTPFASCIKIDYGLRLLAIVFTKTRSAMGISAMLI